MGGLPNVFPGYQPVSSESNRRKFSQAWGVPMSSLSPTPGLTVTEIMSGALRKDIRAIYVVGENPLLSDPNINHVREALKELEYLVVQDLFINETGEAADVILPAVSFAEKEGTFTNTERRVQLVRKALDETGEAHPDWLITANLANRMGANWEYRSTAEIFDEMAALTPQYAGMSHERLEQGSLQWPCPTPEHPGTAILHVGEFARGKGLFSAVDYKEPAELPDEEYPFILSTGRILFHWHGGTLSRRSPALEGMAPEAEVEIHPEDAERLGLREGQTVRVQSRRGQVEAASRITERSPAGTVFMTFHYAEAAANLLTSDHIDPVAKIPEYKVSAVKVEPASQAAEQRET
jgi:predicted molibdopterin-dependent oxidoreductase YjgC